MHVCDLSRRLWPPSNSSTTSAGGEIHIGTPNIGTLQILKLCKVWHAAGFVVCKYEPPTVLRHHEQSREIRGLERPQRERLRASAVWKKIWLGLNKLSTMLGLAGHLTHTADAPALNALLPSSLALSTAASLPETGHQTSMSALHRGQDLLARVQDLHG